MGFIERLKKRREEKRVKEELKNLATAGDYRSSHEYRMKEIVSVNKKIRKDIEDKENKDRIKIKSNKKSIIDRFGKKRLKFKPSYVPNINSYVRRVKVQKQQNVGESNRYNRRLIEEFAINQKIEQDRRNGLVPEDFVIRQNAIRLNEIRRQQEFAQKTNFFNAKLVADPIVAENTNIMKTKLWINDVQPSLKMIGSGSINSQNNVVLNAEEDFRRRAEQYKLRLL